MSLQTTSQISRQDDDGLGKRASDGKREVESLLFVDSAFSLRLLRAYASVKSLAV